MHFAMCFVHGNALPLNFVVRYMKFPCQETHGKVRGNFHVPCQMFRKRKKNELKIEWNFHRHFSLTVKMLLEISSDIFLPQPKCRWKCPKPFLSHSLSVAGNFHRHSSPTAKMSLEISKDIFISQPKCRWKSTF